MIHPDKVNPQNLTNWLWKEDKAFQQNYNVDFNGCDRLVTSIENRYLFSKIAA